MHRLRGDQYSRDNATKHSIRNQHKHFDLLTFPRLLSPSEKGNIFLNRLNKNKHGKQFK
jgi:hypothetical protein